MIQLALLFLTYVASKVYSESLKVERKKTEEEAEQQRESNSTDVAASRETMEKRQLRHLQGSLASMGFFAVRYFVPGALPLGLVTYLYNAIPTMKNVEEALVRDKKVNVDVLFFVADVLTFATANYFTAAFGLTMIHAGRYQVSKAKDDSAKMLTHLFRELPQSVWTLVDGQEVEIPLADVRAGDLLIVTSGGVIPVDGVIQEGTAQIDQCALTGEAQPAEREKGDPVFANTIVLAGKLLIRVERSGADTTSALIAAMLLKSGSFKTGVQLKGERWADQMSLPMLASSMALLPFIGPTSTAVFI